MVQRVSFSCEIDCITRSARIPKESPLRDMQLFLDGKGLLRLTGQLQLSEKTFSERHSVVLPKKYHYSVLLVNQAHRRLLHAGVNDTLLQIREQYWTVRARQLVKKKIRKCILCQRTNSRRLTEMTAPLPADRVKEAEAFVVMGMDFVVPYRRSQCRRLT